MGWEGDLPFRRGGMREGGVGQGRGDACIDVICSSRSSSRQTHSSPSGVETRSSMSCSSAEPSARKSGCAASKCLQQQLFFTWLATRRSNSAPRPQRSPSTGAPSHGTQEELPWSFSDTHEPRRTCVGSKRRSASTASCPLLRPQSAGGTGCPLAIRRSAAGPAAATTFARCPTSRTLRT